MADETMGNFYCPYFLARRQQNPPYTGSRQIAVDRVHKQIGNLHRLPKLILTDQKIQEVF
jgi:hypothetical protein